MGDGSPNRDTPSVNQSVSMERNMQPQHLQLVKDVAISTATEISWNSLNTLRQQLKDANRRGQHPKFHWYLSDAFQLAIDNRIHESVYTNRADYPSYVWLLWRQDIFFRVVMPLFKPAGSTHLEPSQQFIRELR